MPGINTSGGNLTGSQEYTGFQAISVVNHTGASGNVTVTLADGNTIRIFAGESWGLPYLGKPYNAITVNASSAGGYCDVCVIY